MIGEVFKVVSDYPNYEVSNYGRVRNIRSDRIMSMTRNKSNGWYYVTLRRNGITSLIPVQRVVAEAFLEEPKDPDLSLLHRDGDRSNNSVENLVWRPRWFVVKYMRQINWPSYDMPQVLVALKTGQEFQSIRHFALVAIQLPSHVRETLGEAYYGPYGRLVSK